MFSIHRNLFLALKKVQIIKITPPQVPITRQKNCLPAKFPIATPEKPEYCSHPWIVFSFNWLVIIWRGREVRLKLDVQDQGGRRILDVDEQGGGGY